MIKTNLTQLYIFLILFSLSLTSYGQKAVLYNFDFKIPDGFRHEIQEYDEDGKKKYIENSYTGKMELHRYIEPITLDEVGSICDSAAEMIKRQFGYEEVIITYPKNRSVTTGKVTGFPNKGFKRTAKKNKADAYITMEFEMKDNTFLGAKNRSLWWEESGRERTIFTDVTFSFTIYDPNEGVISHNKVNLIDELQPLFSENYNTEIVDKGFKVRKLYFTKSEIMAIYKMAEKKLESGN
jgi:hypothetical protein